MYDWYCDHAGIQHGCQGTHLGLKAPRGGDAQPFAWGPIKQVAPKGTPRAPNFFQWNFIFFIDILVHLTYIKEICALLGLYSRKKNLPCAQVVENPKHPVQVWDRLAALTTMHECSLWTSKCYACTETLQCQLVEQSDAQCYIAIS